MDKERIDQKDKREEAAQPQNHEAEVQEEKDTSQEKTVEKQSGQPQEASEKKASKEKMSEKQGSTAEEKAPADETKEELAKAQEELKKQKEILLRTAAEYDNYRKRTEREKAAVYTDATAAAVTEFLGVADNLERALEQKECSVEDLRKGVEMVQTQLMKALSKLGVEPMGKAGETFDPDLHNAVSHIEDENAGENTITQVFLKGYKIGDKVIRHAMVQVAN
ncbi:MAG: nucleotide exchange factor GrpE [Eubacteriales bacterium]